MRNLLKSAGFVLYFLIAQCLATVGFIVYKIYADKEWMNALCNTLETSGAMSTEYLKLICEICLPMLVIADIIIIIPLICRTIVKREIFLRKPSVLCMLNMISLGLLLNFNVSTIITILPQSAVTSKYDSLMEMAMNGGILLSVLSSAILAPIAEELIFRYGICGVAYRKNWKFGMILSAAMFGVMHMNPIQSTYAFLMGLVLAYVYIKSDYNLLISITVHIAVNGSSVLYEYLPHSAVIAVGAAFVVLTIALDRYKKKLDRKRRKAQHTNSVTTIRQWHFMKILWFYLITKSVFEQNTLFFFVLKQVIRSQIIRLQKWHFIFLLDE